MQRRVNQPLPEVKTSEPLFTGILSDPERARLPRARVLVAGLGNIGSFLALLLARLGVGRMLLIDRDRVEQKNLANQAYSRPADIGRPKVDAIAELIQAIHPSLRVETFHGDLEDVPLGRFADVDLCLGALDSLGARQTLANDAAAPLGLPLIDGGVDAAGAWLGRVQVFLPGSACLECAWGTEHYRQLAVEAPCGGGTSAEPRATLAPALLGATVASAMAAEAVKLLVGRTAGESFEVAFDLANGRWLNSSLNRAARCRYDHRVVATRLPLDVAFSAATVSHLLGAIRERFGETPVRLQFRRGVLDHGAFGQSRFATVAQLESYAGCRLASLGLSQSDRVRVDTDDQSAFMVFKS